MAETERNIEKTSLYERAVEKVSSMVRHYLHEKTDEFVKKSIAENAPDNPRLAKMIEFEVRRRGDGMGISQDVAEPSIWIGIKTATALGIAAITESMKGNGIKLVGKAAAAGIILNNIVETFRLVPRYISGLQGSVQNAMERWRTIEKNGTDPFEHSDEYNENKKRCCDIPEVANGATYGKWTDYVKARDAQPISR